MPRVPNCSRFLPVLAAAALAVWSVGCADQARSTASSGTGAESGSATRPNRGLPLAAEPSKKNRDDTADSTKPAEAATAESQTADSEEDTTFLPGVSGGSLVDTGATSAGEKTEKPENEDDTTPLP